MLLKFQPNPQSLEVTGWRYGIPSRKHTFFFSYLWNFLSLESRPYLFRIMTTEKYKSETAAARRLMTIIWRKLVFRIRGHPTGEMLKCQEAGKRQERPILKCRKTGLAKAVCSTEASLHLHWSKYKTFSRSCPWFLLPLCSRKTFCRPASCTLLLCYVK